MGFLSIARIAGLSCMLGACAPLPPDNIAQRLDALLPADVILLGEQHDAPDHHRLERALVLELAQRRQLGALVMEMAEQGRSTAGLARDASDADVQSALQWDEAGWAWKDYGPVVMAAVQNGVPVLGSNLPRAAMRTAMTDATLDSRLSPDGLARQRDAIRDGHCMMLPESQIAPMTRIQIARDAAMAQTLLSARQSGKTVLLVAGAGHVLREIGVPVHLPRSIDVRVVRVQAGATDPIRLSDQDVIWETPRMAPRDHCAEFKLQM
jgi:uncharacterized iron-regulated protein